MDTKALRQKILDLAIRGKLVPQDPNDEPAEVLLERIREQKQQMFKEGKLKKKDIKNDTIIFKGEDNLHYEKFQDGTVKCIEDEIPFEVPEGWAWCKLNDIYNFIDYRGATPTKITNGIPLVTAKNVKSGYIDYTIDDYISEEEFKERQQRGISKKGDILFTTEAPLGNAALADMEKFSAGQRLITFQQYGSKDELINYVMLMFILSDFFQQQLYVNKTGSTVAGIKAAILKTLWIPVPPYNEQLRISNTLKSAINLIDSISKNKEILSTSISNTKSKILDLAIRGKIVPQDPNDEPASVLLERIRAEKEELIKQGKIKRDKKESVIFKGDDNSYYLRTGGVEESLEDWRFDDLPETWKICCLWELCDYGDCINVNTEDIAEDAWILDLEDIEKDTGTVLKKVTKAQRNSVSTKHKFHSGQVLYSKLRPYLNKVVLSDADGYCTSEILPLEFKNCVLPEYARYYLMSGTFIAYANHCSYGVKMPRLGTTDGKKAIFSLPPLSEQKRIVETIDFCFMQLNKISEALA
ncbi:restriction endonuclease subunit S [Agathobacter rectalis]|mgnify:FL=1|jgi:type I restriction enzyme S subunit|uniref:Restriction endonuclease subunit S n=1 Tax=Agathobacter rectalis TaxID=39491 RepID=A0A413PK95_9FIRM|nr:restriction endonuclease subunit S [Agathobacter rectalis]RGZ76445.1 restriction endonuclease subunit S [Agathobacter rectalis]RHA02891.1 restriction endonuclease subunit S [Agathobacter rectalis]RHL28165.1 restriction endonuclease subunit S [Agathobacter rectalis]